LATAEGNTNLLPLILQKFDTLQPPTTKPPTMMETLSQAAEERRRRQEAEKNKR
jgi:hypothetical protein